MAVGEERWGLIVASAPVTDTAHYASLIREADLLIAADGGLGVYLAEGRMPHVCIGDFDSVDPNLLERAAANNVEIIRYPAEKNESDLDLAVAAARERGVTRLTFTAAFGGRVDHTMAALGALSLTADIAGEADEPGWRGYALDADSRSSMTLREEIGTVLSVLALRGEARVSIEGVHYPVTEVTFPPLSSLGLSNVATSPAQTVTVHAGSAVLVVNTLPGAFTLL